MATDVKRNGVNNMITRQYEMDDYYDCCFGKQTTSLIYDVSVLFFSAILTSSACYPLTIQFILPKKTVPDTRK